MTTRHVSTLVFAAGLAALLAACPAPQVKPEEKPAAPVAAPAPVVTQTPTEKAAAEYKAQGQVELDKALDKLHNVRVFFEFDAAALTKEASDRLSEVGEVLARHPELDVNIAGHADERGSSQYNLALGQKRAESVKKYLAKLGVKEGQIKAVSFGSEQPLDPGHDEAAWKQNRRADVQATDAAKPDAPKSDTKPDAKPADPAKP
jgi:peptidoglycan-associated lipoprotein